MNYLINIKGGCGESLSSIKRSCQLEIKKQRKKTMKRPKENLIAGIDLHSNNLVIGVINQNGKRPEHRKLDCDLKQVVAFFKPLKSPFQSLAVESTFNWYWLVDGLRAQGYERPRLG